MVRRTIRALLILAGAAGVGLMLTPDEAVFARPARKAERYAEKIGEALARRHGLALLLTFDEPTPVDWVSGSRVLAPGTVSVPGRFGRARAFDGEEETSVQTPVAWADVGTRFTVSTWVRLEDTGATQDFLYTYSHGRRVGLRVLGGRMTFHIPSPGTTQEISYPFLGFGRYVHLAAVADGDRGIAELYEDGVLMASSPIAGVHPPAHNVEMGKMRWYGSGNPMRGEMDETFIACRAMDPGEISSVHLARAGILTRLEPGLYRKYRLAGWIQVRIRAFFRTVDRFHPGRHPGPALRADLPEIQLHLSKRDQQHLNQAHHQSLDSGRRTHAAARMRDIKAAIDGRLAPARLALAGSDLAYTSTGRPALILEVPSEDRHAPPRVLRLTPPEDGGLLAALVEAEAAERLGLPHVEVRLVRLNIHGRAPGIYLAEDFHHLGVFPGREEGYYHGLASPADWPETFREVHRHPPPRVRLPPAPGLPLSEAEWVGVYDRLERQYGTALRTDPSCPIPSRETAYRLRRDREALTLTAREVARPEMRLDRAVAMLNPFDVLGANPSPDYIVHDLPLPTRTPPGVEVSWTSSHPGLITAAGRVLRPDGDRPQSVTLSATLALGQASQTVDLVFRVMPRSVGVPAIMLHVREPLANCRRVEMVADLYDGWNPPRRLTGLQGTGGGIKYRGNATLWQRKKSFSLRFDEPHHLLDQSTTRHLYLMSGYHDATRLRNRLSFDIFRSFGSPDHPRPAPRIDWAEVFVNGRYHGLYEIATRVDQALLDEAHPATGTDPPLLLKFIIPGRFRDTAAARFVQVLPSPPRDSDLDPYHQMLGEVFPSGREASAHAAETWLDLENLMDFQILLNLTENRDGDSVNLYLARRPGLGSRFFVVPWDYDRTFARVPGGWLSNDLVDQVAATVPGYRARLRDRWQELRAGPLATDHVLGQIDPLASRIGPQADMDSAFWGSHSGRSHHEAVAELRSRIQARLDELDTLMERRATAPP